MIWMKLSLSVRIGAGASNENMVVNPAGSSEENVTEVGGSANLIDDAASSRTDSDLWMNDSSYDSTKKSVGLRVGVQTSRAGAVTWVVSLRSPAQ